MNIQILDQNLQTLSIVDDYESLQWVRKYSQVGEFVFYAAPSVYQFIQKENLVYLGDTKELGIIEGVELSDDKLIVRGRFYDCVYDRELCYPTWNFYNKYPEEIIYQLLHEYYPTIRTPSVQGFGEKITLQVTGKTVLEVILSLCATQSLGFQTTFTSVDNTLHFSLYQGLNRLPSQSDNSFVSFSENFGTLADYQFTYDIKKQKNYALVAGAGEGTDRITVIVDWSEGATKKKIFVDARDLQREEGVSDTQYQELLRQRGAEKLSACVAVENIEVTPIVDNLVYQTDYDLGDLCATDIVHKDEFSGETIFRASLNKRIGEIVEVYENGYQTLHLTLGEQYPTLDQAISGAGGGGGGSISGGGSVDIDKVYPVGSIYMSVNSTNPATLFGGTWESWGVGRVPVGVDTSDGNFDTVEKTGGSKYLQSHNHPISIVSTSLVGKFNNFGEGPGSNNVEGICSDEGNTFGGSNGQGRDNDNARIVVNATHSHSASSSNVGDGNSQNLQPYITCYMWKRTA